MHIFNNLKSGKYIFRMDFGNLIVFFLLIITSTDKTLSFYNKCEKKTKIQPTFAEIFGQRWEKDQNSNWQNDQNELNLADSIGNDHNNNRLNDQQKCEIVHKFHAIKDGIKKRGKYSSKFWNKIEQKIAKKLGSSRGKIYKWKKGFRLNLKNDKNYYEMKKKEFIERIDEFKRMSKNGTQKQFAKDLGIDEKTFRKWKKELDIKLSNAVYSNEQKMIKMNDYYKMKNENPILTDREIAGLLKISPQTLIRWKREKNL